MPTAGLWISLFALVFAAAEPSPAEPPAAANGSRPRVDPVAVRQSERNWVDGRWDRTQVGPFLASNVPLPGRKSVAKGLSIRVGPDAEGGGTTVCYDTQRATLRAAWTGGFLKFDPARYGLIAAPKPAGDLFFNADERAGWEGGEVRYRGLRLHGERVVLACTVGETAVRESPWAETRDGLVVAVRTIEVGPSAAPLALTVHAGRARAVERDGRRVVLIEDKSRTTAVAVVGPSEVSVEVRDGSRAVVAVPAGDAARRFKLLVWSGPADHLSRFDALLAASPAAEDLAPLAEPGPSRWTAPIETRGTLGDGDGPYVVDTLTLPFDNPYSALLFTSGHDFLPNGDVAVCTVHGDVWTASGVDADIDRLVWKRLATGLFQPLGLKVVGGRVHVLGRDQITRLTDENGDGEADAYDCVSNVQTTSTGGHDYVAGLETDAAGNFYFIHATQGVVRISPDGRTLDVMATGFRNPNGLSVGPDGTITAAPQEGNWTPASCVIQVRPGGHYGFGGPRPTPERPLGYDLPICWIPRPQDNSSGGQVWVEGDRWGPFAGQLIHLSYGQCRMMLVLRETIDGQVQGGVVDFPLEFDSGAMRGRFSPHDGQLYVSGLKGWSTSAIADGCLQRVRYTGKPVDFPVAARTLSNGFALTFTRPPDRATAENPGSYAVERWNYRYGSQYGSADYRVSDGKEGRDEVAVKSATLLDDGRTVFLEIPDMRPANQMSVRWSLRTADGTPLRQTLSYTVHRVGEEAIDPARLHRPSPSAETLTGTLRPGVAVTFEQQGRRDARPQRFVALNVPAGAAATPFLEPGQFAATFAGVVRVPIRGDYEIGAAGSGAVRLTVNGQPVTTGEAAAKVALEKGDNPFSLRYESGPDGAASLRLLWSADGFPAEPIPPTALFHDGAAAAIDAGERMRHGRELFASRQCARCHLSGGDAAALRIAESVRTAPDLRDAGGRLDRNWVAAWLLDPRATRPEATMPRLFADNATARQDAADVAAYLATLDAAATTASTATGTAEAGERLYADLGCVACHRLTPAATADEHGRLPLAHLAAKYRAGRLAEFLRRPHARHVGSRMPDFGLADGEAASLAAFLRHATAGTAPTAAVKPDDADPVRGRRLFGSVGCGRCHADGSDAAALPAIALADADRGCLAERLTPGVPDFAFAAADRTAVAAFVSAGTPALDRSVPAEASARLFGSLRCGGCHDRDGDRSPRRLLVAEETGDGLDPETLPALTWSGEKLQADWTRRLLAGDLPYRARPSLKARMPAFPEYADVLAVGLAAEHGLSPQADPDPPADPTLADLGRRLVGKDPGLDCRQCHGVGRELPLGDARTLLAPGINFTQVRDRLRHDFYSRFVLDPPRYDVGTKMPKLSADGRTTKARDLVRGDARRQFEAIWQYVRSLPDEPPPDGP